MPGKRQQIYVNTRLQFRFSVILIILVTIESMIVGWLISYAFNLLTTFQTEQRMYTAVTLAFFVFACITVFNIYIGTYLSHKIAGPIYAFQQKMKQIRLGDISRTVDLREGDELADVETDMNEMIRALQHNAKNDGKAVDKAQVKLAEAAKKLKSKDYAEASRLLEEARAELKETGKFFKVS